MKKNFYIINHAAIEIEDNKVSKSYRSVSSEIDDMFFIEEDGIVASEHTDIRFEVKAGDLVVVLYGRWDPKTQTRAKRRMINITANPAEYSAFIKEYVEHRKEEERRGEEDVQCDKCYECEPQLTNV